MRSICIDQKLYFKEKKSNFKELELFFENLSHKDIVVAACPCRVYTELKGTRACRDINPVGVCVFTGDSARHLEARSIGLKVSVNSVISYLKYMISFGLDAKSNTELSDNCVVCLCCGCCCSHLKHELIEGKFNIDDSIYIKKADNLCSACGLCVDNCITNAILTDANGENIRIEEEKCIGCGICEYLCPEGSLTIIHKDNINK